MTAPANDNTAPRLITKKAAAAHCGVSAPTFVKWVLAGAMPPALPVIKKWDRKAIDLALDKASGLEVHSEPTESALEKWVRENAAA
jgi:hypothetical protein